MNNTLSKIVIFAAGVAIGSAVTWKIVKTKYEQIALEEIQSVRDYYDSLEVDESSDEEREDSMTRDEYKKLVKEYERPDLKEEEEDDDMEPYVISPDEYDENGYETVTLYYYADGVLAEAYSGDVIEDVDGLVGEESLTHFGEYEDDSVFVRNDRLETDFEILRDERRFSEVE